MPECLFDSQDIYTCSQEIEKRPLSSLFLSVRLFHRLYVCLLAWNNSTPTGWIFVGIDV